MKLRRAIDSAAALLADAGIDSARCDAEQLAAHLAGVDRGRLTLLDSPGDEFFERYREVVTARSRRVPLQHVTGTVAFGPVQLHVGPGVFIPRPETESILEWATAQRLPAQPVIVDLCTGSGALAVALAHHRANLGLGARVIGIDDSDAALDYARRNSEGTAVELLHADVTAEACFPNSTDGSTWWWPTRRIFPTVSSWIPKWPTMIHITRCSAVPDGMRVITAVVALAGALASARWPVRRRT